MNEPLNDRVRRWGIAAAIFSAVALLLAQSFHVSYELGAQSKQVSDNDGRSRQNTAELNDLRGQMQDRRADLAKRLQRIEDKEESMQAQLNYLVRLNRGQDAASNHGPGG